MQVCVGYLEFTWHNELRSVNTDKGIHATEDENGQDDGEVTDELPHLEGTTLFSPMAFRDRKVHPEKVAFSVSKLQKRG